MHISGWADAAAAIFAASRCLYRYGQNNRNASAGTLRLADF
jgi:hypothetical protein